MFSFRVASLRSHLIFLVLVALAPVLAFSFWLSFLYGRDEYEATRRSLIENSRALALSIDRHFHSARTTLEALATLPDLDYGDYVAFRPICQRVLDTQGWHNIILFDRSGQQLINLVRPRRAPLPKVDDRESFEEVLRTKRPVIRDLRLGTSSAWLVGIHVPVIRKGEINYVLTAVFKPDFFTNILKAQKLDPEWVGAVFDSKKIIVATTHLSKELIGEPGDSLIAKVDPKLKEGWLEGVNHDGTLSYGAFSRSSVSGWSVAVTVPASLIDGPWRYSMWRMGAAGILFLSGAFCVALFLSWRLARPIESLALAAQQIGEGKHYQLLPSTVNEVEHVGKALAQASELLRERSFKLEQQASMLETAYDAIIAWQQPHGIFFWNRGAEEMYGWKKDEAMGKNLHELLQTRFPQSREVIYAQVHAEGQWTGELIHRSKDERLIVVTSRWQLLNGETSAILEVNRDITDRKRAEDELRKMNEKLEERVAQRTAELAKANQRVIRDIEERRQLEEELRQAHKMDSLGTLAGGIAHDFNNILGIISGYLWSLKNDKMDPEEQVQAIAILEKTVQRGSSLVKQLLTLARKTETRFDTVDLNTIIEDLVKLLKRTFPKEIELTVHLESIPLALADSGQITQALLNICLNARDAMPTGGKLRITSRVMTPKERRPASAGTTSPEYVCLTISDNGIGMDEAIKERLFEPFFTTKGPQGTGLGLAVVYGIIQGHGGSIDLVSEKGKGTTVRLYLPTTAVDTRGAIAASEMTASDHDQIRGEGTVLLVEDEPFLRTIMKNFLAKKGYRILTAKDGMEAVEFHQQQKENIAIVVLDLGLPKLSGRDAFLKMKESQPELKVVVASGYIEPELKAKMLEAGVNAFIGKPYTPDSVLTTIQSVLGGASEAELVNTMLT